MREAGSRVRSATRSSASLLRPVAAQQRPQARQQFGELERLGEVVVGTTVQPSHLVRQVSRAVSSRIGVWLPRARTCRQTSRPSTAWKLNVEHIAS